MSMTKEMITNIMIEAKDAFFKNDLNYQIKLANLLINNILTQCYHSSKKDQLLEEPDSVRVTCFDKAFEFIKSSYPIPENLIIYYNNRDIAVKELRGNLISPFDLRSMKEKALKFLDELIKNLKSIY